LLDSLLQEIQSNVISDQKDQVKYKSSDDER